MIRQLIGSDIRAGMIASAEMGFQQKIDLMGSLFWHRLPELSLSEPTSVEEEFREVLTFCRRSAELRNRHLHSRYSRSMRAKTTAKANRGLDVSVEPTKPDILLDVADFIASTAMVVEEFPLSLGIADRVGGDDEYVEYSLNGRRVALFKFGAG